MKTKQKIRKQSPVKSINRHAKMVLVPHAGNQYRPHLIRSHGITVVLLLIIVVLGGYNFTKTGSVLALQSSITTNELLDATNKTRVNNRVAPLMLNSKLSQAATLKADDMFKHQYWAHISPGGTTPWHWYDVVGYKYDYAGENLAKNFDSTTATMTAWMASPEHRDNILNTHYSEVGFAVENGVLQGQNTVLVVALFGNPADHSAPIVTGAQTTTAPSENIALVTRLGVAIQSLSPVVVGSAILLLIVASIAYVTHLYRRKLPRSLRQSWYRHHGIYKAIGMLCLVVVMIALYGSGQI